MHMFKKIIINDTNWESIKYYIIAKGGKRRVQNGNK